MLHEMHNNVHKIGFDKLSYDELISELEYHKAKMMLAIRVDNRQAVKEYIADSANFLLAIGDALDIYSDDFIDIPDGNSFEINRKIDTFIEGSGHSLNQTKIQSIK